MIFPGACSSGRHGRETGHHLSLRKTIVVVRLLLCASSTTVVVRMLLCASNIAAVVLVLLCTISTAVVVWLLLCTSSTAVVGRLLLSTSCSWWHSTCWSSSHHRHIIDWCIRILLLRVRWHGWLVGP